MLTYCSSLHKDGSYALQVSSQQDTPHTFIAVIYFDKTERPEYSCFFFCFVFFKPSEPSYSHMIELTFCAMLCLLRELSRNTCRKFAIANPHNFLKCEHVFLIKKLSHYLGGRCRITKWNFLYIFCLSVTPVEWELKLARDGVRS